MRAFVATVTIGALLLSGCAKKAEDISAAYVSPMRYSSYSCKQLENEMDRLSHRISEVADAQNKAHKRDVAATTVGMLVFWPALFFLASGDKAEELSRLKGEYEAIMEAGNRKNCAFYTRLKEAERESN